MRYMSGAPEKTPEKPEVLGLSTVMLRDPHTEPVLKENVEAGAYEQFAARYGFEATDHVWLYEDQTFYTDPASGEVFLMPERWMLLVEGTRPVTSDGEA